MQTTLVIELNNRKTLSILKELESLNLLRIVKKFNFRELLSARSRRDYEV